MADLNDPLPGSGVGFWTMAAAAAGSLLTLRTMVESSPTMRMLAVLGSWTTSFFATPAVVEYFSLGMKGERLVALLIAFVGVNVLAGIATFSEKFRQSPTLAIEWAVSLLRGTPK
jgi:hypothetical protein